MGHGAIVPRGCLLWNWVANVVTELTYPDPRLNRPEPTHEGYHCYAASALLEEVRPREPREVRCVALTAVSKEHTAKLATLQDAYRKQYNENADAAKAWGTFPFLIQRYGLIDLSGRRSDHDHQSWSQL